VKFDLICSDLSESDGELLCKLCAIGSQMRLVREFVDIFGCTSEHRNHLYRRAVCEAVQNSVVDVFERHVAAIECDENVDCKWKVFFN
jgi:hypothetical protein